MNEWKVEIWRLKDSDVSKGWLQTNEWKRRESFILYSSWKKNMGQEQIVNEWKAEIGA